MARAGLVRGLRAPVSQQTATTSLLLRERGRPSTRMSEGARPGQRSDKSVVRTSGLDGHAAWSDPFGRPRERPWVGQDGRDRLPVGGLHRQPEIPSDVAQSRCTRA